MLTGKQCGADCRGRIDVEQTKVVGVHNVCEIVEDAGRYGEFAQAHFGGNLKRRDRADIQGALWCLGKRGTCRRKEARTVGVPEDKGDCVEQQRPTVHLRIPEASVSASVIGANAPAVGVMASLKGPSVGTEGRKLTIE